MQPEQALAHLARAIPPPGTSPETQYSLVALPGDAGFRRYFRFDPQMGWLGVYAPPGKEDMVRFLQVARLLADRGLKVPRVQVADVKLGYALMEDWGDCLYQDRLSAETASALYAAALESLGRLARTDKAPAWLPRYNRKQLQGELDLFAQWFVQGLLNYRMDESEQRLLSALCRFLVGQALEQPRVLVHRDFHCRNLMDLNQDQPGLIDFQDAAWGPVTYDLASLCRDYYVRWSPSRVETVVADFAESLVQAGRLDASQRQKFPDWFEAMSAQRHIKVLGIFARLNLRDKKMRYLNDLPLVIRYLMETTARIPAACEFRDWFASQIIPLACRQNWYSDWQTAGDDIEVW